MNYSRKYGPRQRNSRQCANGRQDHDATADPKRGDDVTNDRRDRDARDHDGEHSHGYPEDARVLPGAVQTEGEQADDHDETEQQCRGPQRPFEALEFGQIGAEAHDGGKNECHEIDCELDHCEYRNRHVHVFSEQSESHSFLVSPTRCGRKALYSQV
jgi:hypothetical protein